MNIKILEDKTDLEELSLFGNNWYENFLKGTVDIKNKKVAVGGEWHIESLEMLVAEGGNKDDIWGFNILFPGGDVEYHSMVNIKPSKNHKDMIITDIDLQSQIRSILAEYINFK